MTELSIVQPYVPSYRVPFFEQLSAVLGANSIDLRVIAGSPTGSQAKRGDAARPTWLELVNGRIVSIKSRQLSLTYSKRLWRSSDAVIVPHQGTSLDALAALIAPREQRVGVWGHIAPYTSSLNPIDGAIERWQLRRADHVFSYTAGGRAFAIERGVADRKITVLNNTADTNALGAAIEEVDGNDVARLLARHNVPAEGYLAYVGGLDETKRIDFLRAALDELHQRGSDVHVVVAGRGDQETLLDEAVDRGQVTMIGYANTRTKATLLVGCIGLVNPGRVGLLAVDALVAHRPILTTDWPWHAPEFEYLSPGRSVVISPNDPRHFAELMDSLSHGNAVEASSNWPSPPSLSSMVQSFASGVTEMLAN